MAAEKKPAKTVKKSATAQPKAASAAKKAASSDQKPAKATKKAVSAEDDMRHRFEEALARKREKSGAGGSPHDPGRTVVPQSNTKTQRTFRRKSGG